MEEMRQQFEAWCANNSLSRDRNFDGDGYFFPKTNLAWSAWQASRGALVVEMPEPFKLAKASSGLTYYYEGEVDKALRAAGITVKGEGDGQTNVFPPQ